MAVPGASKQKKDTALCGINVLFFTPEEVEQLERQELNRIFLEHQETIREVFNIIREQERMILHLQEQNNLNKADRYGSRSERSSQLKKTDTETQEETMGQSDVPSPPEAPGEPDSPNGTETETEGTGKKKQKGQPKRNKGCIDEILKDLPVHRRDLTLSLEELIQKYGTDKVKEGPEKVYRTCRYIPGFWYVEEVHVHTSLDPKDGSIFLPARAGDVKPYKGSYYSNEMLAFVFDQRFTMAAPFYRIEKWLSRNRLYIHRQPLAAWAIRLDRKLFSALICRMWHFLRCASRIQIDESPTIVSEVRKRDKAPSSLCYMWNFRTSELLTDVPEVIIFHFDESRGEEVLDECLPGYTGTITSDGHSPYHGFAEKSDGAVTNTGCLNHSRTRFARVIRANPELKKLTAEEQKELPVFRILELFGKIFQADTPLAKASPEERLSVRQEKISGYFKELSEYINSFGENDFDQSGLMYDAIQYFKNQKPYLEGFLQDPYVPSNNSACERDFASYGVLRNNIKFIDSLDGGSATADLYSLAATAKAHGLDFYTYILYVLRELPAVLQGHNQKEYETMEELDAFMPWTEKCKSTVEKEWEIRRKIVENGELFYRETSKEYIGAGKMIS